MDDERSHEANPLLARWTGPFEAPPFECLQPSHFGQAVEAAIAAARAEIAAISANPDPPSFENSVDALERSGRLLTRVSSVFFQSGDCRHQ
jgi:peptidyl-dipeptidase Dcp